VVIQTPNGTNLGAELGLADSVIGNPFTALTQNIFYNNGSLHQNVYTMRSYVQLKDNSGICFYIKQDANSPQWRIQTVNISMQRLTPPGLQPSPI
jgi:hypothetical protein